MTDITGLWNINFRDTRDPFMTVKRGPEVGFLTWTYIHMAEQDILCYLWRYFPRTSIRFSFLFFLKVFIVNWHPIGQSDILFEHCTDCTVSRWQFLSFEAVHSPILKKQWNANKNILFINTGTMCELIVCGKEAISFFFRMHGVIGNPGSAKLFFIFITLKVFFVFY